MAVVSSTSFNNYSTVSMFICFDCRDKDANDKWSNNSCVCGDDKVPPYFLLFNNFIIWFLVIIPLNLFLLSISLTIGKPLCVQALRVFIRLWTVSISLKQITSLLLLSLSIIISLAVCFSYPWWGEVSIKGTSFSSICISYNDILNLSATSLLIIAINIICIIKSTLPVVSYIITAIVIVSLVIPLTKPAAPKIAKVPGKSYVSGEYYLNSSPNNLPNVAPINIAGINNPDGTAIPYVYTATIKINIKNVNNTNSGYSILSLWNKPNNILLVGWRNIVAEGLIYPSKHVYLL